MLPTDSVLPAARGKVPSALRNPDFVRLWVAQAISQTAQNAVFYALLIYVEERTQSSFQLGILVLSTILPFAFFGFGAGVLVDRWPKRQVLAISNLVRVPISLLYLVFLDSSLMAIYVLNLMFTTVSQFFAPAEAAAIPLVVKREQLLQANGLFNLMLVISQLLGYVVLGPPLVKVFGTSVLFFAIAGAYAVATFLVATLPIREVLGGAKEFHGKDLYQGIVDEMKAGLRLVRSDTGIALAVSELTVFQNITLATGVLAPGFVSRILGINAEDAVYVLAPAGVGILLGAIAVPRLAHRVSRDRLILTGLIVVGAMFLALAAVPTIYSWISDLVQPGPLDVTSPTYLRGLIGIVMLITHVMGWGFSMVVVTAQTVLQERTPEHMRARVFAFQFTFANVVSILPLIFFGILADLVGINRVLALIGLIVLSTWYAAHTRSHEGEHRRSADSTASHPPAA